MLVKCEVCDETIASADHKKLKLPLESGMFDAIAPEYASPWWFPVTWEHMRCPICGYRPFVMTEVEIQAALAGGEGPTTVMTTLGPYRVGDKYAPGEVPGHVTPVHKKLHLKREWEERMAELEAKRAAAGTKIVAPRFVPKSGQKGGAADGRAGSR